jgi:hypothetical protein
MEAEQITFIANRRRSVTTLVLAAIVATVGIWALMSDHPISGFVLLVVSAVPAIVSLSNVISPRSVYVSLDPSGFEFASRYDKGRVQWRDVAEFRRGFYNDRPVIEIEYVAGSIGRIYDRYNAPLPHILDTLIEWRRRYAHIAKK